MPGVYTVKLTANNKSYTQTLTIKMDPRVKTATPDLQLQHDLSYKAYKGREEASHAYDQVHRLRAAIAALLPRVPTTLSAALKTLDEKAAPLEGAPRRGPGRGAPGGAAPQLKPFAQLQSDYATIFAILQEADSPPTVQATNALEATEKAATPTKTAWTQLQQNDLAALNAQLKQAGLDPITIQ